MTATTSDEAALCAAIRANPDCDTVRLVYADWLTENDQEVLGELIRVQVEIASVGPMDSERGKLVPLRARESALAARLAEWPGVRPACPACHGGWTYTGPGGGQRSMEKCEHCTGSGRVGSWVRGMLAVPVPTLSAVWAKCDKCREGFVWEEYKIAHNEKRRREVRCPNCNTTGHPLTPWARDELLTRPWVCEVPILDREPFHYLDAPKFGWCRDRPTYNGPSENVLPPFLYDLLPPGNVYDTRDAARTALARATAQAAFSVAGGAGGR